MSRPNRRKRRVTYDNANRRLPLSNKNYLPRSHLKTFQPLKGLRQYEDRRTWHPLGPYRPAKSFNKFNHRLVYPESNNRNARQKESYSNQYSPKLRYPSHKIGFEEPHKVLVCVRRTIRREVLHARGIAGSSRRQRVPVFSEYSKISCKKKR